MSTSSYDAIFGLGATRVIIPPGSTQAILIDVGQVPGGNSVLFKYFSGSTLEIFGATLGTTLPLLTLAAMNQTGYIMNTTEILSFDGPTRFYASATGGTTVAHMIYGKSQGT